MSSIAGRVFTGLTRVSVSRRIFIHNATPTGRLNSVRPLALSTQKSNVSKDGDEVDNEPLKFSTSKASHRTWKVQGSMGSQHERPWWKVLPISLVFTVVLLWAALREETDIDVHLEKELYEQLPGLLSDDEDKQAQNESS